MKHLLSPLCTTVTGLLALAGAPAEAQDNCSAPTSATLKEWDVSHRQAAVRVGTATIRRSEPALQKGVPSLDERRHPWRPVTVQTMRSRNSEPCSMYKNKTFYSLDARVDYDADGHVDVVEMVENGRQAGIRVTWGGRTRRPATIIYKGTSPWSGEEIFAAGRSRVMLERPELGIAVFFRQGGLDRAQWVGD
jgi:hypothetical protein